MEDGNLQQLIEPGIHTSPSQQGESTQIKMDSLCHVNNEAVQSGNSKPQLIIVPYLDESGHEKGFIQEVFQYPPGSIKTFVERKLSLISDESNLDRACRRGERKNQNQKNASENSIKSSHSGFCAKSHPNSVANAATSHPTTQQPHSDNLISHRSRNNSSNNSEICINSAHQVISPAVSLQKWDSDRLSDSSSNISTISDLSGYEDEYLAVKNFLAFGSSNIASCKKLPSLSQSLNEKFYMRAKIEEQENIIKSLQSSKDDLEIQVHRFSTQLKNVTREKEVCQEQLDIMLGKINERDQQEYFELQKEKANLQGQYEALKIEYQHCLLNSEQSVTNLSHQKIELEKCAKEKEDLFQSSKKYQSIIQNLEDKVFKLEDELKVVNQALSTELNTSLTLKTLAADKENCIRELETKTNAYLMEVKSNQETIDNFKKWNLEYAEREENHKLEKAKIESLLADSTKRLNVLKENNEWYQQQLSKVQNLQSSLQSELTEAKNSLAMLSTERDRYKGEAKRLNTEIEDNRANAVREKSSLLVQLEELEADMREREATISRLEKGDEGIYVKVSEERFQILEDDHKKLQKLKIEIRDNVSYNNSLKEELKHKTSVLKRHEETIHNLRKDLAVIKEEEESKQLCIDSLTEKLNLNKSKLAEAFEKNKENEVQINHLKKEKVKLEASLSLSEEEKKHVDDTVLRLREDMNKLSSSFYKMKHDLLVKDKRIETLSTQNEQLVQSEKELRTKTQVLNEQVKLEEHNKLIEELDELKKVCKNLEKEKDKGCDEICQLKKSLLSLQAEKQSLSDSVEVRDGQIMKLQEVIETYKEKVLTKEKEITTRKEHFTSFEKTHNDLQKRFTLFSNELELIRQERDEYRELEIKNKNSISALKECVRLEKQSKENYTKKYEETLLELRETKNLLSDKIKMIETLNNTKDDFEKQSMSIKIQKEEVEKLKEVIENQTKQICDQENTIKSLNINLEESKVALVSSENKYVESINIKNNDIQNLHEALSINQSKVEQLNKVLAAKEEEFFVGESKTHKKFVNSFRNPRKLSNAKHLNNNTNNNNNNNKGVNEKCEIDSLMQKVKEMSSLIRLKEKEIATLKATLSEENVIKSRNTSLRSELEKMKQENHTLKENNDSLKNKCALLQEELKRTYFNVTQKEKDCNDWKTKYENLIDVIPQRDTDSHQNIDVNHLLAQSSRDPSSNLHSHPQGDIATVEEALHQDFNLEERTHFTKTMAYLQNQISLTAETLKTKDRQILELNEKLNALTESTQPDNLKKLTVHSSSELNKDNDSMKDCFSKNSQSEMRSKVTTSNCEPLSTPSNSAFKQTTNIDSQLFETLQSEKIAEKEAEWKEKQRRYESNVRLLTRKLKEHMKGRRAAEKELTTSSQEHQKALEVEEGRHLALKDRILEMEKESEVLRTKISSCERAKKGADASISNLKEELERERKSVLELQKENGQLEELRESLNTNRTRNNEIMAELTTKNRDLSEKEKQLQEKIIEKRFLEESCLSLSTQVEELKNKLADEHLKVLAKDEDVLKCQEEMSKRDEELALLKETQSNLQYKNEQLEQTLNRARNENSEISQKTRKFIEEIERLTKCIDSKSTAIKDLTTKKDILERELKVKDECIASLRMDEETLKKQLEQTERKYESSSTQFNKRLLEMKEVENSLMRKINSVHKEKMSYQSQCTQLKVALSSALEKLQDNSEVESLPSPSPLNTKTLTTLLERCSRPPPSTGRLMSSLTERLNCLREEVCTLQSEIKARDQSETDANK